MITLDPLGGYWREAPELRPVEEMAPAPSGAFSVPSIRTSFYYTVSFGWLTTPANRWKDHVHGKRVFQS